ncbi:hypothetical protein [Lentilactobacillus sp. Marseille-Q4993]|uniref:hypothetical protein n=1 Tax=Lentilactobacillus sp. Marseille-Q4993 TaxID=3039492 RepID=UPI0024BC77BA|nr:hypothetical protein [Lentilactobacillus sp. Marseille-Q4993]
MIINILVMILIFIAFFIGSYLLSNLRGKIFNVDMNESAGFRKYIQFTAFAFFALGLIGVITVFMANQILMLIDIMLIVILGSVTQAILVFKVTKR